MDAADIMFKMAETYANCRTYQDRGLVRHFENESSEDYRHRVAFKTSYASPDRFYFEWALPPLIQQEGEEPLHRISALWNNAPQTAETAEAAANQHTTVGPYGSFRHFHSQTEALPCANLDQAISAAASLSKGASITIAAYILPSLRQKLRTLFRLRELNLIADDTLDGVTCHYLRGRNWSGTEEEFWIDRESYLLKRTRVAFVIKPGVDENQLAAIRKIDPAQAEEYRKFREAQTEERRFWNQIDYHHCAVNEQIADSEFVFEAQAKSDLIPSFAVL